MSADWKVGDKALCIATFREINTAGGKNWWPSGMPRKGTVYLVGGVQIDSSGMVGLLINGHSSVDEKGRIGGWDHCGFRKIVPVCDRVYIEKENTL